MKFCQKCGKEIMDEAVVCLGCGCPVATESKKTEVPYEECLKGVGTTNIISAVITLLGVVCWLLINVWVGVILCLVAEMVALSANSKLLKAFKQNGLSRKSKQDNMKMKAIKKELKANNSAYKFSMILGIIDLVLVCIFVLFTGA
jgi:uncharacterized membrane protein YkgB